MKPIKSFLSILPVFLMLWFMCMNLAVAAQIKVTVDRNPVSLDESFRLTFTSDEEPDGNPDFSPLEQDFDIINQGQSSNLEVINGNFTKSVRWTLELTAKRPGKLDIPAIQFGNDTSEPLPIMVNQSGTASDNDGPSNEDIYLDVKAEPESPYVQSQVIFTVRVYRRVDITQAELSEPALEDAVIEKLGEDSNFNTVVNGVSYLVTERKYAIFPQKSGSMTIKPLSLTAQVIVANQPDFRDFFGSRMTKTKRVLSKEVALNVKPAPAAFKGKDWLAAEKVELTQEWSGDIQQMKTGEPLTRTLTLKAEGATVGQLPELNTVKTSANLKAYPDQPVLNENKQVNGVTATRQEKIALIPSAPGKQILPALEIPWFNLKTQKMEVASLPETVINVGGSNEVQPAAPSPKPLSAPATQPDTQAPAVGSIKPELNVWMGVSLFLALGWLATLFYFLTKRPKLPARANEQQIKAQKTEMRLKECLDKLKAACSKNNPQAAKDALLAWGKLKFNVVSLGAVAEQCDARLRDEILYLNQTLYGNKDNLWNGKKLFQAFTENKAREKVAGKTDDALAPLHRI